MAAVIVSNPLKTRALAEAKVKTDKVDAEVLAQLLRCDYLPAVWHPDEQTQRWRGLVTHRTALMTQRARIKNHVQSLLGRLLAVQATASASASRSTRNFIAVLPRRLVSALCSSHLMASLPLPCTDPTKFGRPKFSPT